MITVTKIQQFGAPSHLDAAAATQCFASRLVSRMAEAAQLSGFQDLPI
jgi:hypothetical protein